MYLTAAHIVSTWFYFGTESLEINGTEIFYGAECPSGHQTNSVKALKDAHTFSAQRTHLSTKMLA